MFTKSLKSACKLDKAIALSVAAMLGMNLFVLAQQMQADPALQLAQQTTAVRQA